MKISKLYSPKIIYPVFFAILCGAIFFIILDTGSKYQKSHTLSNEVNTYLENVSLKQVRVEEAEKIIEFISPTSTSVVPANLNDPFEVIEEEEE